MALYATVRAKVRPAGPSWAASRNALAASRMAFLSALSGNSRAAKIWRENRLEISLGEVIDPPHPHRPLVLNPKCRNAIQLDPNTLRALGADLPGSGQGVQSAQGDEPARTV